MERRESPVDALSWQVLEPPQDRTEDETGGIGVGLSAFGETYRQFLPRIHRYLRTRTASAEDAADLTQQVFLQAWEAFPGYQDRGLPFAAWLFRIARNAATDFHRRRRITVAWDLLPEALHPLQPDGLDAGMLRRETVERLRALLLRLNPDERELLALRFVGELTLQEIGLIVGKSESGVQRQLTRILRRLKEQYRDD
jgi:RNA polymerase sigma-70 factor (ECF subfamily)